MHPAAWPTRTLIVDVEGNGAQPPEIVELAAIPVHAGRLSPATGWTSLIRPRHPINRVATGIHRITNDDVANAPAWTHIAGQARTLLEGSWLCAHNASVEYHTLTAHLPGWEPAGVIDTMRVSRHLYGKATKHSLDALIEHTGINVIAIPGSRHRATFDAHATGLLLLHMARHFDTWEQLAAIAVPGGLPGTPEPEGLLW